MKKRNRKSSGGNAHDRRIRERESNRFREMHQVRGPQPRPLITRQQSEDFRRQMEEDRIKRDAMPKPVHDEKYWDEFFDSVLGNEITEPKFGLEITPVNPIDETGGLDDEEEGGKFIDIPQLGTTPPEQFGVGLKPTPEPFSAFDKDGKYVKAHKSLEDLSAEVQAEQRRRAQESFYAVTNSMLEQLAEAERQKRPRCDENDLERLPTMILPFRKFIENDDTVFELKPDIELPKLRGMGAMDPREHRKSLARRAVDAVKRVFSRSKPSIGRKPCRGPGGLR